MQDQHREVLEAELREARRQREQLDAVITYLSGKLGLSGQESVASASEAANSTGSHVPAGTAAAALVSEMEFYGMSSTKAAKAVLEKVGRTRPLKTDELLAAILKGGVKLGAKKPGAVLYRSLWRDKASFHKVGKGRWGLSAWYGGKAKRPKGQAEPSESGDEETGSEQET